MNPLRLATAVLLLAGLAPVSAALAISNWRAVEDIPGLTPVQLNVQGESRVYFSATAGKPLKIAVAGPLDMKLVSRLRMDRSQPVGTYTLHVLAGGKVIATQQTETGPSKASPMAGGNFVPAKSRTFEFHVPAGVREVSFRPDGSATVFVRLFKTWNGPTGTRDRMISLTPLTSGRTVTLVEGEKQILYYSVTHTERAEFRVIGPTPVQVLARLDFGPSMRGSQRYTLTASLDERELPPYVLQTTKATAASYRERPEVVPSKYDTFSLDVPAGVHVLSLRLAGPAGATGEVHVRIPSGSLENSAR